jgi:hypothetical protein
VLEAIDYQTGKIRWTHELGPGGSGAGVLTTDSGLTFTGDAQGTFLRWIQAPARLFGMPAQERASEVLRLPMNSTAANTC